MRYRILLILLVVVPSWADAPWTRHAIDASSEGADGVRLADVNNDGLLDIATGWEEGALVRVYLHPGYDAAHEAWPKITVGRVKSPEDAVLVDLDGDGAMDVVSCTEGKERTLYAHWAPSDSAQYQDETKWKTEAFPWGQGKYAFMFCLPMDIDGKHGIDLIIGAKNKDAPLGWLEAPEDPRNLAAWQWHPIDTVGWIMSLQAADMDGDGDDDLLVSNRRAPNRGVYWYEHPGAEKATTPWQRHTIGGTDKEVMFLTWGDLDDDGIPEIVVAVKPSELLIFSERAEAWEMTSLSLPENAGTGKGVALGDIDNDGITDIVFSCENAVEGKSGVLWLKQEADGFAEAQTISGPDGIKFDRIELVDIDGDGAVDVLTCEERDQLGVIWYENR